MPCPLLINYELIARYIGCIKILATFSLDRILKIIFYFFFFAIFWQWKIWHDQKGREIKIKNRERAGERER